MRKRTHDTPSASSTPSREGCDSHQHLALPAPTSSRGGLCHVTATGGRVRASHVTQGNSRCETHLHHTSRWPVRGTPTPRTFSAKKRQTQDQRATALTGIKPQLPEHSEHRGILGNSGQLKSHYTGVKRHCKPPLKQTL